MTEAQKIGHRGEQAAINYLKHLGWQIVKRNYRLGHKEIDLIACRQGKISLFEIKTRQKINSIIISPKQKRALKQAHLEFCSQQGLPANMVNYALIIIQYYNNKHNTLYYYSTFL